MVMPPAVSSPPTLEQVTAALATVDDPEIHRPSPSSAWSSRSRSTADGLVRVAVLLTVSGCPMRDNITSDVTAAVGAGRA